MPDSPPENLIGRARSSLVQLSLPIAPLTLQETEVQQRIEVIQQLISAQGTDRYGKLQQQAAKKLGMSVRSVQRLVKRLRGRQAR